MLRHSKQSHFIKSTLNMKIRLILLLALLLTSSITIFAQNKALTPAFKTESIETLSELMNDRYVFPEVAKKTETHLKMQLDSGHFDKFENLDDFATALTESVQSINHDKHMRIRPAPPYEAPENSPERMIEEKLDRIEHSRRANAGFVEVKLLEGNVGYLDLRGFAGMESGKSIADSYMKLMSNADAVIVDLRKNGGGSPNMVQYLCSYFFDTKVHLNSLYWREGDRTTDFYTLDDIGGEKMPDVPLFVLTSNRTFSGAEEFSYNMQTQKRATLIGQTSGGGANPGGMMRINADLGVFIPTGKAINPITKTNWEGVGVIPEVNTSTEETMDKAHELAKLAAEEFRTKNNEVGKTMLTEMFAKINAYTAGTSEKPVGKAISKCLDAKLIREDDINMMGYEYLLQHKKPDIARAIFKSNTILHPNSANVHDSYGEVLAMKGDFEQSIKYYERAVKLAEKNKDGNLELFQENLAKVKKKYEEGK